MATNLWDLIGTDPYGLATPEQQAQVRQGSLMDAGLAMLLASQSRRGQPRTTLGEGLARGLLTGRESYQTGLQNQLTAGINAQKMREAALQQQARQQAMTTLQGLQSLPEDQRGAALQAALPSMLAAGMDIGGVAKAFGLGEGPQKLAPGEILVGPGGKTIATGGEKPEEQPAAVKEAIWFENASPEQQANYLRLKQAGANPTNITIDQKTAGAFGEAVSRERAKAFAAAYEAAKAAPSIITEANRIESQLNNPNLMVGPGADYRLALASALNIAGANNEEIITNTQNLMASLANVTLEAIKTSGLGTGQGFTDKDLKFLERARGGQISFTKERLKDLVRVQKIVGNNLVNRFNSELASMPEEARGVLAPAGIAPSYLSSPSVPSPIATETVPVPAQEMPASAGWGIRKLGE